MRIRQTSDTKLISLTSHFSVGWGEKNPEKCENEKCEVMYITAPEKCEVIYIKPSENCEGCPRKI